MDLLVKCSSMWVGLCIKEPHTILWKIHFKRSHAIYSCTCRYTPLCNWSITSLEVQLSTAIDCQQSQSNMKKIQHHAQISPPSNKKGSSKQVEKSFQMKTSGCRDGIPKKEPNKVGKTPQDICTVTVVKVWLGTLSLYTVIFLLQILVETCWRKHGAAPRYRLSSWEHLNQQTSTLLAWHCSYQHSRVELSGMLLQSTCN